MDGARTGPASTALRLDRSVPLRTRQASAAPRLLATCPAPPDTSDGVRLIPTKPGGVVNSPAVSHVTMPLCP
jgi:hypothetical protein